MRSRIGLLLFTLLVGAWCIMPGDPPPSAAEPAVPPNAFAKEGVAFLAKHCIACHGPEKKKADLVLHTFKDDASLLKDRKTWDKVLQMLESGEMPPQPRARPALAEVEAFTRTVAAVFDRADRSGKRDPGRVTIRRLNRTEYNNTIRDLVGVDFQPAEDFPSDDVGHGFDNIGDVLSLSPVLLERYLAAAESIMQRAITVELPKPTVRHQSGRYLEPATSEELHWRPLTKGFLHTPYRLNQPGQYTFRFRAHGRPDGGESPKVAVLSGSKEIKKLEIAAPEKTPEIYEAVLEMPAGDHRLFASLLNPSTIKPTDPKVKTDPPAQPRAVFVEWFELHGPRDTRPETQKRLLAVKPGQTKTENTREVLTRFASKAYRRPATKDELDRLVKLVEKTEASGEKWEAGVQLAMQAVLVSPKFLFRVELDDRPTSTEPHPIDEWQLANRLSYFLWSSMPDEELFELARKGELTRNLEAQTRRMLKDPKARALVDNFAMQWLQIRPLANFRPDPKRFPQFDESLRSAMFKETELFFEAVIREDRGILDLIDADFTFLNERLARHYGIVDTNGNRAGQKVQKPGNPIRGDEFKRVSLQPGDRGGLLMHASVLTVTSNPTRTSPVKRGRWVLDQLLGTPPPPPPPNVPELNDKRMLTGTLRQQMEQHRANPSCAACHARMDPIGFAFENFDAIGAFRAQDGGQPIDPSGVLPSGQSFKGPGELKQILKGKKDLFSRCLTEKLLTYALGRGVEYPDKPAVDTIVNALPRNDYKFSTLATEIVKSEPFRLRRGKEGPTR
jgi:mono/diheme cytochrome c family protein